MTAKRPRTDPEILEMPARTMAVERTCGDPNELGERVFKGLTCRARARKNRRRSSAVRCGPAAD
jgi:hypothetical protein